MRCWRVAGACALTLLLWAAHAACAAGASINVLGGALALCSREPLTGWYRSGFCETDAADGGVHVVCAQLTDEFLRFTRARGNDLVRSPPGLRAGDRWCLCAGRWAEAHGAGVAPPVVLEASEQSALRHVTLAALAAHAVPRNVADEL